MNLGPLNKVGKRKPPDIESDDSRAAKRTRTYLPMNAFILAEAALMSA